MTNIAIEINWNKVILLIGHGIENAQLESFMFETLKLDESLKEQDPIDDWSHRLESECGILLTFEYDYDFESDYAVIQKSEGGIVLGGMVMYHGSNRYKDYIGKLPYKLNFSMMDDEVRNHLIDMFIQNIYREDGKVQSSIFYDSKNKVMMTVGYEYPDNIQKMCMVYIYAPDNESVEEYGIGPRIIE